MTTTVDSGLEWAEQRFIGGTDGEIDGMAVGSGSKQESPGDTSLENRISDIITKDQNPVRFVDYGDNFQAIITVQGGSEVPTNSEIREVGIYAETNTGEPVLIARDSFDTITINPGHSVEFTIEIDIRR